MMIIDVHCHTFNATDISRAFLTEARVATGWKKFIYYLPGPIQVKLRNLLVESIGEGPTAAEEIEQMERFSYSSKSRRERPDIAGDEAKRRKRLTHLILSELPGPIEEEKHDLPVILLNSEGLSDEDLAKMQLVDFLFAGGQRTGEKATRVDSFNIENVLAPEKKKAIDNFLEQVDENEAITALEEEVTIAFDELVKSSEGNQATLGFRRRISSWVSRAVEVVVRKAAGVIGGTLDAVRDAVLRFAKRVVGATAGIYEKVERAVDFIFRIRRSRRALTSELDLTYDDVDLFTPALVDYSGVTGVESTTPLADQVRFWRRLVELHIHNGRSKGLMHPLMAFDPYWLLKEELLKNGHKGLEEKLEQFDWETKELPDLDEWNEGKRDGTDVVLLLRVAIEKAGFIGAKIYPPALFAPFGNEEAQDEFSNIGDGEALDKILLKFYEYCRDNDVPILAHASDSNAFARGAGELAGPDYWQKAFNEVAGGDLEANNTNGRSRDNLRVCFGHFGHLDLSVDGWSKEFAELMDKFPFVYGDISNTKAATNQRKGRAFVRKLWMLFREYPDLEKKVLYGSDWMLNTLHSNHEKYLKGFQNLLSRHFFGHKTAILGLSSRRFLFETVDGRPNKNHERLKSFYTTCGGTLPDTLAF